MKNEKLFNSGSALALIAKLGAPVILVMLVNVLYNMADIFFIGRTGDVAQVAAVSLASPLFSVISALNTLWGFGACTAISIAIGQRDRGAVDRYSSFSLYASLITGAVAGAGLYIFEAPLLALLGADSSTAGYTGEYLRIIAFGAPFMIASGALGNSLRADGDSAGAVIAAMTGTVLNVVLDPIFICLCGMGVRGAALATVAGNIASFAAVLPVARRKGIKLALTRVCLRRDTALKVAGLGAPMAAGTLLMSFSSTFANRLYVQYGNEALAANSIAGKSGMLCCMLIMGICIGIQPAVSYAYGNGDKARLLQITRGVTFIASLVGVVLAVVFIAARGAFVKAFIDAPELQSLAETMVIASAAGAALTGVCQMGQVFLQGTEAVSEATFAALLQKGIVFIPALFLLNRAAGLNGLIWAGALTDLISAAIVISLCVRRGKSLAPAMPAV